MSVWKLIQKGLGAYERLLNIHPDLPTGVRVRARAVYSIAWAFILLQSVNWVSMFATYGGFHPQHMLSLTVCVLLFGVTLLLRRFRSPLLYGAIFGSLLISAVILATLAAASPLLGGGINTSLLPLIVLGPLMMAIVGDWRCVVAYTVAALALIGIFHNMSTQLASEAPQELLDIVLPGTGIRVDQSLAINIQQRTIQVIIGLVVCAITAGPFGHTLYLHFDRLEQAAASARQSESAKGDFLAHMSHEIRTPLGGVVAMADLLQGDDLPEVSRRKVEIISRAGQSLMEIVNDVLDDARLEAGQMELFPEPFNLRAELESLVALHSETARKANLWIGLDWQEGLGEHYEGDAKRIRQIASNFVSNALKFTEHGGVRVGVRGRMDGGTAQILVYVQDTGAGIAPSEQARIFERFGQSQSGRRQGAAGTGLGLVICRELAELMGGTVRLTSAPGEGSVFMLELTLPVVGDAEATSPRAA